MRIGITIAAEPRPGRDERGRHAIEGPREWVAERLQEYVDAGCDGFIVNLGHEQPRLDERVRRFAEEVLPLL